jgi:hypothetical protein
VFPRLRARRLATCETAGSAACATSIIRAFVGRPSALQAVVKAKERGQVVRAPTHRVLLSDGRLFNFVFETPFNDSTAQPFTNAESGFGTFRAIHCCERRHCCCC